MKKIVLGSLISLALLAGCDDKPDTAAVTDKVNKTETAKKPAPKAKSNIPQNQRAEELFKALSKANNDYYAMLALTEPSIKTLKYEVSTYEKGEESASATSILLIEIHGMDAPLELVINHDIQHNASTESEGFVAKAHSTIAELKGVELSEGSEEKQLVDTIKNKLFYDTKIREDGSFEQVVTVEEISYPEEKFTLKGLDITTKSTIEDIAGGFGQVALDFKGLDADGSKIEPFVLTGEYKNSGDFTAESKGSVKIHLDNKHHIEIGKIKSYGNLLFDKGIQLHLGEYTVDFDNINFTNDDKNNVTVEQVAMVQKTTLGNNDDIALDSKFIIKNIDTGIPDVDFKIDNATFGIGIERYPIALIDAQRELITSIQSQDLDGDNMADLEERVKNLLADDGYKHLKEKETALKIAVDIQTSKGQVFLNGNAKMQKDSTYEITSLEQAGKDALEFITLTVDAFIDESLVNALSPQGAPPMMMLFKNGERYELKITSEGKKLLVNGQDMSGFF